MVSNDCVCEGECFVRGRGRESLLPFVLRLARVPIGCRFVDRDAVRPPAEKDALQVTGSVPDLENASPFDEGRMLADPVFPLPTETVAATKS